jgi:hypothetical protein
MLIPLKTIKPIKEGCLWKHKRQGNFKEKDHEIKREWRKR